MKNIVLIGMMGAAKSTTGRIIAEKLNRPFFDGDDFYVTFYHESVSETFSKYGEEEFRRREAEIYRKLGSLDGAVIACGGGVVLKEENMLALSENGVIVCLTATPEAIFKRVSGNDKRPLLRDGGIEKIVEIMQNRKPLYEKYAHFTVDNTYLSPKSCAELVIGLYRKNEK